MHAIVKPWGSMHSRVDAGPGALAFVFLNSLGTDLRMWDGVVPKLKAGPILRLDFRGHGLSSISADRYGISDLADDVLAAMDDAGLAKAVVIGCSVGGLVAQALALRAPARVRALVLSNTAARIGTVESWQDRIDRIDRDGMAGIAPDIVGRWFGPTMQGPDVSLWQTMLARTPAPGYIALCKAIAAEDLSARVADITAPCLVIAGTEDQSTPPAQVEAFAAMLPGADFRLMDGIGHLPAIEAPERFAGLVARFIEGVCHD